MSYINYDFPHTRNQDSDLREILELYKALRGLPKDFADLKTFVNDYFENLDVQNAINVKIDALIADGTIYTIFSSVFPYITPQMFGAKADGINDDTNAIAEAINQSKIGGVVYLPSGTYIISGNGLDIRKPISIIGENIAETKIKAVDYNANIAILADNITIKNFTLYSDGVLSNTAILLYNVNDCIIEDIIVDNVKGIGIGLSNAYKCRVCNCIVTNINNLSPAYWCGYDTVTEKNHGNHLFDNVLAKNIGLDGFICDDNDITISNSTFNYCGTLVPSGGALGACGIYCDDLGIPITNLNIINCHCNYNSESGIDLNFAKVVKIVNSECSNNGLMGIVIIEGDEILISGNTTIRNGNNNTTQNPTAWAKSGICFTNHVAKLRIINNASFDDRPNATQHYGIQYLYPLESGEEHANNTIIIGNNLKYNLYDDANLGSGYPQYAITNLIYDNLNA